MTGSRLLLRQQSGLALILVLMIFAIISVLATVLIKRQSDDLQRAVAQFSTAQARAMVDGVEAVVRSGLYLDWENDPDIDHALEEWNIDRTFPMENGMVFVHITDAQGRINLNWMAADASNRAIWKQRFYKLLNDLGLDVTIADHLYNWFDEDSQVDNDYLSLEVPYRAAYNHCKHTSELMLVANVDVATYKALEPYIACLPVSSQLNINTASASVLAALDSVLTLDDGQSIIASRGDSGFAEVADFMELDEIKAAVENVTDAEKNSASETSDSDSSSTDSTSSSSSGASGWTSSDFTVTTQYFEVFAQVGWGESAEWMATSEFVLKRAASTGKFTTLYRDFSRRKARVTPST